MFANSTNPNATYKFFLGLSALSLPHDQLGFRSLGPGTQHLIATEQMQIGPKSQQPLNPYLRRIRCARLAKAREARSTRLLGRFLGMPTGRGSIPPLIAPSFKVQMSVVLVLALLPVHY